MNWDLGSEGSQEGAQKWVILEGPRDHGERSLGDLLKTFWGPMFHLLLFRPTYVTFGIREVIRFVYFRDPFVRGDPQKGPFWSFLGVQCWVFPRPRSCICCFFHGALLKSGVFDRFRVILVDFGSFWSFWSLLDILVTFEISRIRFWTFRVFFLGFWVFFDIFLFVYFCLDPILWYLGVLSTLF